MATLQELSFPYQFLQTWRSCCCSAEQKERLPKSKQYFTAKPTPLPKHTTVTKDCTIKEGAQWQKWEQNLNLTSDTLATFTDHLQIWMWKHSQKNNFSKPGHSGTQSWCSINPQLQKNHSTRHLKVTPAHVPHYQSRLYVPTSQQWHL